MNTTLNRLSGILAVSVLLGLTSSAAIAGGLVDTSLERFMGADFTTFPSDEITNRWWTLPAGMNFLYFAEEDDECAWNLVEVLNLSTDDFEGPYAGTDARVVLDREWVDEDCQYVDFADVWANLDPDEVTYDWYAQDVDENIWYMGEDTRDSEGSSEGSFVAGCDGAEAGIVMLGDPTKGDFYQQEFFEDEAEDWGKVLNFVELDGQVCLKTKEWTPLDTGHNEHKLYCSDGVVGELVLIYGLKGKTVTTELIDTDVDAPPMPAAPPSPTPSCS